MIKLISSSFGVLLLVLAFGAYYTFSSNANENIDAFGQFSSEVFKETIRRGYKLVSDSDATPAQQEVENLDEDTPTEESGILPGPAPSPTPPPSSAQATPAPSSPANPPPAETDGEGPNVPGATQEQEEQAEQQEQEPPPPAKDSAPPEVIERQRQDLERRDKARREYRLARLAEGIVKDYYYLIAQGQYQEAWGYLSPEFKAQRNLDYQGYECFWKAHQPYLKGLPKTVLLGRDHARVYADWKVTSNGSTLYDEPVVIQLTWNQDQQTYLINGVKSRIYRDHDGRLNQQPPREHMRPASYDDHEDHDY